MLWPLVVLGVRAADRVPLALHCFIAGQLTALSRHIGSSSPLAAKDLLESSWRSGRTQWDEIFDKRFIFTSQIAVDTLGLISSPGTSPVKTSPSFSKDSCPGDRSGEIS